MLYNFFDCLLVTFNVLTVLFYFKVPQYQLNLNRILIKHNINCNIDD